MLRMDKVGGWWLGFKIRKNNCEGALLPNLSYRSFMMRFLKFTISILTTGLILGACSGEEEQKQGEMSMSGGEHAEHANMKMQSDEPTDESIYNVSSIWQNQYGNKVKLDSLRGKVQVVAMVYTSCEYACPRILADMQRIQDGLSGNSFENTNFTIISIDPERDTPERLNAFAKENNLTDEQWTLLHGDQGDILEIAALLGVKYKRISESDFTHSNIITLLNQEGEVVYQRKKLTDNHTEIIETIEKFSAG